MNRYTINSPPFIYNTYPQEALKCRAANPSFYYLKIKKIRIKKECFLKRKNLEKYSICQILIEFKFRKLNRKIPPRKIIQLHPRLLQIAAFLTIEGCCEMLKQFGFRPKMYYLCLTKGERAHKHGAFSSFCVRKSVVLPRR